MGLTVVSSQRVKVRSACSLTLRFEPERPLAAGARFWLYYDVRQGAGDVQCECSGCENYIEARHSRGDRIAVEVLDQPGRTSRSFDLFPRVPEFHALTQFSCIDPVAITTAEFYEIELRSWRTPDSPIDPFHFWLVVDEKGEWRSVPTGFKNYRKFVRAADGGNVAPETLRESLLETAVSVVGDYRPVPAANKRKTPGVYWGELHGMAFNQRPLDDFYAYAKGVTELDFAAAIRFSYNISTHGTWEQFKEAARRHTEPGRFVAVVGLEAGTPPDDSHRCAYFPEPDGVPPILADSRPPAHDPDFLRQVDPDTVVCSTLDEFYGVVERYGGFVGGHFHTKSYDREVLAEIWQKQYFPQNGEEKRLFEYLRQGKRFALVGGSDTHDSMPGNPYPEPGCPRPAGFTGVWTQELTTRGLMEALLARRVFATSGARIVIGLESDGKPMGSLLGLRAPRSFEVRVEGTSSLRSVELLRDGLVMRRWEPEGLTLHADHEDRTDGGRPAFYLVRVRQADGHTGWSSPIWFG